MSTEMNQKHQFIPESPVDAVPGTSSQGADDADDAPAADEFYERHEIVADPKQSLIRLDKFLIDRLAHRSRNKVQNAIRAGSVKVDEQEVKPNYKVKPGNVITIVLPKSLEEAYDIVPQNIPLDIVYEDQDVLIVNKPYNLAVHPGVGIPNGTLVNAVAWHLQAQLEALPVKDGNESYRAGIVHRIDKDTTGLMVVAKKRLRHDAPGQPVFSPHHRTALPGPGLGRCERQRRHGTRQYRAQPERPTVVYGLSRRRRGQARHHALEGAGTVLLLYAGRMPPGDGPYPPDPRPHEIHRAYPVRRPALRRQPDPEGYPLRQIQTIH